MGSSDSLETSNEPKGIINYATTSILVLLVIVGGSFLLYYTIGWFAVRSVENGFNTITASVSLANIDYIAAASNSSTGSLNATFNIRIELKCSADGIDYVNTTLFLRYKGTNVDRFPIAGAHVPLHETRRMDFVLALNSREFNSSNSSMYSDLVSGGALRLQAYVRFTGRGRQAQLFKIRSVAESTCDIWIDLSSRTLSYSECHERVSSKE